MTYVCVVSFEDDLFLAISVEYDCCLWMEMLESSESSERSARSERSERSESSGMSERSERSERSDDGKRIACDDVDSSSDSD